MNDGDVLHDQFLCLHQLVKVVRHLNNDFFWFFVPQYGDGGVSGAQFIVHDDVRFFISDDDVVEQLLDVDSVIKANKGDHE